MTANNKLKPAPQSWLFVERLRQIVDERNESMGAASLSIGAAYSALGQYGSKRFDRPTPEILRAIVEHWNDKDYVPLIVEHLKDELVRANLDPSTFTIVKYKDPIDRSTDAAAIFRAALASPGWANILSALAVLAKRDVAAGYIGGSAAQTSIAKVAEAESGADKFQVDKSSAQTYDSPKKTRKRKGSAE